MHKARRMLGLAAVFAMAASLLVVLAVPAHAASGTNVVWLNPVEGPAAAPPAVPFQFLSSKGGMTAELTAALNGGDDAAAADSAYFYMRDSSLGLSANWVLLGIDTALASFDHDTSLLGHSPRIGGGPAPGETSPAQNWKAAEINVNTATFGSAKDFLVVACGSGHTSLDGIGAFNPADKNVSNPLQILPFADCDGIGGLGGFPIGFDFIQNVGIDNVRPVIREADYPAAGCPQAAFAACNGYNADGLSLSGFQMTYTTTPDVDTVLVSFCADVVPDLGGGILGIDPARGDESSVFAAVSGSGSNCAGGGASGVTGIDAAQAFGTPPTFTAAFNLAAVPGSYAIPAGLAGHEFRHEAVARIGPFPGLAASQTAAAHLNKISALNILNVNQIKAVWDYQWGPGDRTCPNGSSAAKSQILPWSLTDADGDGTELLSLPPAPNFGLRDIDDFDNPVLKVCTAGDVGLSLPTTGIPIAWEIVSGPGGIDADTVTYVDLGAFICPFGTPLCSGGFGSAAGFFLASGYSRPGSIMDAPLATVTDPFGRGPERVCALGGGCQHGDITDGLATIVFGGGILPNIELGNDRAAVNSAKTGLTTYKVCVDIDGDRKCGPGERSALATMDWSTGLPSQNRAWINGTESATCLSGQSTISIPAGASTKIVGCPQDPGDNPVPNSPVIWRLGLNGPGHFAATPDQTTNAAGKAFATLETAPLDAQRTAQVFFCRDGNADGICDFTPALVEVNIGGPVTNTTNILLTSTPTIGVFGTTFTLTGTLSSTAPPGGLSGATVTLQRRTLGSGTWNDVNTTTTNAAGGFTFADKPSASSDWRVNFPGNASAAASQSLTKRGWVRVGVALSVNDATLLLGQTAHFTGRVLPNHAGSLVQFQVLDDGRGWVTLANARLSDNSLVKFNVRCNSPVSQIFRLTFPTQDIDHAWNKSTSLRIFCS